jgi:hypothetical protein
MTLVGRDAELGAVSDAVAETRAGAFRALVLTGEAGIGKTSLVAAAVERARGAGLEALEARAVTHEREVPFALAAGVLDDRVAAAQPRAVAVFGPELAAVLPSAGGAGERRATVTVTSGAHRVARACARAASRPGCTSRGDRRCG